ncbi:nitroreductase family protein [Oceanispirochaeta sp.]|jgi:nitroreductase/NAD-dependent dihydropyrimidine dehydrogenase PreA subunit|uniref:nitroreductase family protein n=1 Tax=Oceanispirochaeta sp. TaxID=2035350 RepID=UPI0026201A8E|nr:nitroreductase family protein [Oceanispirochaeta sp.]MDA3956788.1 nitroreductase family protein [Oceanispirochaeta sp.]
MKTLDIDTESCTQCTLCIKECPSRALKQNSEGFPEFIKESCLKCQHCLAICPEGSLSIYGYKPEDSQVLSKESLPDLNQIELLMKGRRSTRFYKDAEIPRDEIARLLDIAYHAPTGKNNQTISFRVVYTRRQMTVFRESFYNILEQAIEKGMMSEESRFLTALVKAYREKNNDVFFRNAPHLLVAVGSEEAAIVHTDAIIASSYFELATAAAGYGALWNGYISHAINTVPALKELLKLKKHEVFSYALCFGIPDVSFKRTVQRGTVVVEVL